MTICSKETLEKRYLKKVVIGATSDECWGWVGATYKYGYGCIGTDKGNDGAHRVSYRLHYGEIPDGMCVCHLCDNPICSNPKHLFLGTKQDNAIDRNKKGRGKNPSYRGNHPKAKLTLEQVKEIKASNKPNKELREIYNASYGMIRRILSGERWGWVV
jgi:hypothetical protein